MTSQDAEPSLVERRLQDLLASPREDLSVELKGWLDLSLEEDKANLAQAILALANFGGGYVLLGFKEDNGTWVPADQPPPDLTGYSQDVINGIVQRYAEPPFHCSVLHVPHPDLGGLFPMVVVPGDHRNPIRAKRDGPHQKHVRQHAYYIRRPGPVSEPIQSGQEWDDLIGRCVRAAREELVEDIRGVLLGFGGGGQKVSPEEEASTRLQEWVQQSRARWASLVEKKANEGGTSPYEHGIWTVAYAIAGDWNAPGLSELHDILETVKGHETRWPPWWVPTRKELAPYPYDGVMECWLAREVQQDAAHADFWRASRKGMMFLLRGYQEDTVPDQLEPGKRFDLVLPIWRVGECLLHAERLAKALADQAVSVIFRVTWEGLAGRTLVSWANPLQSVWSEGPSRQGEVTSQALLATDRIGATLPEIVTSITKPLYEVFDFFAPSPELVRGELSKMRRRSL